MGLVIYNMTTPCESPKQTDYAGGEKQEGTYTCGGLMRLKWSCLWSKSKLEKQKQMEEYNIFHNYQFISADATLYSSFQPPIHHVNVIFSQVFNQTLSDEEGKVITAILNLLLYSCVCARCLPAWSITFNRFYCMREVFYPLPPSVVPTQHYSRNRSKHNLLKTLSVNWPDQREGEREKIIC